MGRYSKKILKLFNGNNFEYQGHNIIVGDHILIRNKLNDKYNYAYSNGVGIELGTEETEGVKLIYQRNLISNHIQQFRKEM